MVHFGIEKHRKICHAFPDDPITLTETQLLGGLAPIYLSRISPNNFLRLSRASIPNLPQCVEGSGCLVPPCLCTCSALFLEWPLPCKPLLSLQVPARAGLYSGNLP